MITFVFIIMILSGALFILSVLLMTPKWGLWFWITGMATSNEYSSKKSVESTLKKTAIISIILFTLSAIVYPYIAKHQLSTNTGSISIKQTSTTKETSSDKNNVNDKKTKTNENK